MRPQSLRSGGLGGRASSRASTCRSANGPQGMGSISPGGTVVSELISQFSVNGTNDWLLTTDGLLWFADNRSTVASVVGLQTAAPALPTLAFRFTGPGGLGWDFAGWFALIPASQSGVLGAGLFAADLNLAPSIPNRTLLGIQAPGTAALTQWGTVCGDAQHRCSLKVQYCRCRYRERRLSARPASPCRDRCRSRRR